MRRTIAMAGLAICLGASCLLAVTPALAATPAATASPASAGGTAPACIQRNVMNYDGGDGWYAIITNNCGKTMRVKVLGSLSWQESACHTLAPGGSFRHTENRFGKYRKTVVC